MVDTHSTALAFARAYPLTCGVAALCCGIYAWMWHTRRDTDLAHVALSYKRVVLERQFYRIVTATLCHVNAMHLLFNMGTLLSVAPVEARLGPAGYLRTTLLLLLLCKAVFLGVTHAVVTRGPPELAARWRDSSAVGYSGVLFGWMTLQAVTQPGSSLALVGGLTLPFSLAPFVSLLVNQLLVPQASLLGHAAGIVAGYAIAWGLTDFLTGYWFWSGALYAALAVLLSVRANPAAPRWLRRLVDVSPEFSAAAGGLGGGGGSGAQPPAAAAARRYMAGGVLRVVGSDDGRVISFDAASAAGAAAPHAPPLAPASAAPPAGGGGGSSSSGSSRTAAATGSSSSSSHPPQAATAGAQGGRGGRGWLGWPWGVAAAAGSEGGGGRLTAAAATPAPAAGSGAAALPPGGSGGSGSGSSSGGSSSSASVGVSGSGSVSGSVSVTGTSSAPSRSSSSISSSFGSPASARLAAGGRAASGATDSSAASGWAPPQPRGGRRAGAAPQPLAAAAEEDGGDEDDDGDEGRPLVI